MKTTVIKAWPPIMKVSGSTIKTLLEVESTRTVRKKLQEWGFGDVEYIVTDDLIKHLQNLEYEEPFITYDGKAKGSDKL